MPAGYSNPSVVAEFALNRKLIQIVIQVIDHKEVQIAIAVVIGGRCRCRPAGIPDTCVRGDIREGTVAVIPEKDVRPVIGQVKVLETVVVEVKSQSAFSPKLVGNSSFKGHVGEGAIPVVSVQGAGI